MFLALVALLVTMVERIPEMAADEPAKIRNDDELILQFGTVPERVVPTAYDEGGAQAFGGSAPGDPAAAASTGGWYVVQRGDTLSSIALEHLGSVAHAKELARLNALSNPDELVPGDRIRLR